MLVSDDSTAKQVLSKFESPQFIHTFAVRSSNAPLHAALNSCSDALNKAKIVWELPCFGREFLQQNGVLQSQDYSGYELAPHQQLVAEVEPQQPQDDHTTDRWKTGSQETCTRRPVPRGVYPPRFPAIPGA